MYRLSLAVLVVVSSLASYAAAAHSLYRVSFLPPRELMEKGGFMNPSGPEKRSAFVDTDLKRVIGFLRAEYPRMTTYIYVLDDRDGSIAPQLQPKRMPPLKEGVDYPTVIRPELVQVPFADIKGWYTVQEGVKPKFTRNHGKMIHNSNNNNSNNTNDDDSAPARSDSGSDSGSEGSPHKSPIDANAEASTAASRRHRRVHTDAVRMATTHH